VCAVPFVILSKPRQWQTYKKSKSALNFVLNMGGKKSYRDFKNVETCCRAFVFQAQKLKT
jgi:hypothetical protein